MTAVYLNTRGRERHRDYQFVGPAPPASWWRRYADHTTFERPTVLVQSDGRDWQAYLSGIPSRRRDAVGTVIRYTVVVEGVSESAAVPGASQEPASGGLGTGDVLALVATWLSDQDLARDDGQVSAALDAAFPEPDVERLITADPATPDRDDGAEVSRRLVGALHRLRLPDVSVPVPAPEAWLADLGQPAARAAFVQRVDALLAGQPGRALVLNLVGTAADLTALVADPRPLAVLAPDLPDAATLVPLNRDPVHPDPGKASAPPGTGEPESATPTRTAPRPTPAARPHPSPTTAVQNLRGCLRLILVPIALLMALALATLGALFYLR